MSATTETPSRVERGEHRFLLPGVGWEGYEALLKMIGGGHTRVTYAQGDAELMSPSPPHENRKKHLGFFIEAIAEELLIPFLPAGSTTSRHKALDRGLEPDECYYVASVGLLLPGRKQVDLTVEPPPDLAVEVEITSGIIPRLPIDSALGVPEIWRYSRGLLEFLARQPDGTYSAHPASLAFPFVSAEELAGWLEEAEAIVDVGGWRRAFRAWVREELAPRVDREGIRPPDGNLT